MDWFPILFSVLLAVGFLPGQLAAPRPAAAAPRAQAGSSEQKPLAKDEVMDLVQAGMDSAVLARKIDQLGIDFEPTDDYLQALRKAGAQDALVQALRNANPKPLTRQQVMQLVVSGMPISRAVALVRQRGVDFLPDEKFFHTLTVAGASDMLISAVRAANIAVTGELLVATSPAANVYLDGALKGQADATGALDMHATLGAHTLKVSLAGKQDFQQNVTLMTKDVTRVDAPLQDAGPQTGMVRQNSRDGLKYVYIPPGTYMMGCSDGDTDCVDDEKPAHSVTISRGFWIGQTELTVGAYKRFASATGRAMPPDPSYGNSHYNPGWGNLNMPMVDMAWTDARDFCSWTGGQLPTEAQWEYAARAGTTTPRYGEIDDVAWYGDNSGRAHLDTTDVWKKDQNGYFTRLDQNGDSFHEVGEKRANAYGLFDMLGNASEWVRDWYDAKYYQSSPAQDPEGPATGTQRILRGWCWFNSPFSVRVSHRGVSDPNVQGDACGARCAMNNVP